MSGLNLSSQPARAKPAVGRGAFKAALPVLQRFNCGSATGTAGEWRVVQLPNAFFRTKEYLIAITNTHIGGEPLAFERPYKTDRGLLSAVCRAVDKSNRSLTAGSFKQANALCAKAPQRPQIPAAVRAYFVRSGVSSPTRRQAQFVSARA